MKADTHEYYYKIASHIMTLDVFWIRDLRSHMGCTSTEGSEDKLHNHITKAVDFFKKIGCIQCCGRDGSERQYIVVKTIPVEFVKEYGFNSKRVS